MEPDNNFHGKIIPYQSKDAKKTFPRRSLFVDKIEGKKVSDIISKCQPLNFLPTYLTEMNMSAIRGEPVGYKIVLMGVLSDGRRANVVIKGIKPYFEILLKDENIESQISAITALLEPLNIQYETSVISAKQFRYYHDKESKFLKLSFLKLFDRKKALEIVQKKYQTTTNDTSCYYRVVCRDYLTTFSMWATLTNYTQNTYQQLKMPAFTVDIKNFQPFTDTPMPDIMLKDRTLSCCWDIETWSKGGDLPEPQNLDDNIFCLGMTFQWVNNKSPFLKICLCDYPANAKADYLTIVCGNEFNILKCFSEIFELMCPEFIFGFNDSDYDWNWVVRRAAMYPGLLTTIAKNMDSTIPYGTFDNNRILTWNYKTESVKIEATTDVVGRSLMMPGYIPIDVRTIYRKLFPTAEQSSLKYFLAENHLGGKEDMPYEHMFKIYKLYREFIESLGDNTSDVLHGKVTDIGNLSDKDSELYDNLKKDLMDINYYCVVDSLRCHDLLYIRNIIRENREVSNLAYCSVYDAFFRANGMKVRNLTIAKGQHPSFNMRFSNIPNIITEEGKYPGAFVFPPKKGLHVSKLSIDELIQKYPNSDWGQTTQEEKTHYYELINHYGSVVDMQTIKQIEKERNIVIPQKFANFWTEPIGRPITGLDFASLYPSLIRAYNFSPEYCIIDKNKAREVSEKGQRLTKVIFPFQGVERKAWFVWHNNQYDPTKPGFQFGVYPYILDDLFKRRKLIKVELEAQKKRKEHIESMPKEEQSKVQEEYENVTFMCKCLNSKQNALKVFMNTFYGEAGNKRSPFFVMEVAGGITLYGQKNIKFAYAFVRGKGCNVYYGDTDSLYLSVPESCFYHLDQKFYTGQMTKINYWTELVNMTMSAIDPIRNDINQAFIQNNGTKFLSMAYEEVLYPVAFTAKKKYFGIAHVAIPNFKPKELFIRGLEVKKRGVSQLLREICMDIMWAACSPDNLYELIELVRAKIDHIYTSKWSSEYFIQTGIYRPSKNNVKLLTLVERMREKGIEIKPNERFNYVIVKKYPYIYNHRGKKENISAGDKLELLSEYEKYKDAGMEIDLDYYMQGSINGQLGRLITYHDTFRVEPATESDEDFKIAEDTIYKNACKYIEMYCSKYYSVYNSFGNAYQGIFKLANKAIVSKVSNYNKFTAEMLGSNVNIDQFEEWFLAETEKKAATQDADFGSNFVRDQLAQIEIKMKGHPKRVIENNKRECLSELQKKYYVNKGSLLDEREKKYNETIQVLMSRLRDNVQKYKLVFSRYHNKLANIADCVKCYIMNSTEMYKPTKNATNYTWNSIDEEKKKIINNTISNMTDEYAADIKRDNELNEIMKSMEQTYNSLIAANIFINKTRSIVEALKHARNKIINFVDRPSEDIIKKTIETGNDINLDDLDI